MSHVLAMQQQLSLQREEEVLGTHASASAAASDLATLWASYCRGTGLPQWAMHANMGNRNHLSQLTPAEVAAASGSQSGGGSTALSNDAQLGNAVGSSLLGIYEGSGVYSRNLEIDSEGRVGGSGDSGSSTGSTSSSTAGEPLLSSKWVWQPVAIPFTAEMTKWLNGVVQGHQCDSL
jgi:hypothetical protein